MAELPAGTVTFLFTDLEGSTRLWEQYPDAMKAASARHDALLREAIEAHHGSVVKMTGDGAHAVFASARHALDAAVFVQQRLQSTEWENVEPFKVRMGLHTAETEMRDGDYFGSEVNRAARLMNIAHGGQIVVSSATASLAEAAGIELRDLGEHRLAGLSRPERVWQVSALGLGSEFPPLRSLDARPGNLPRQMTSFVGRDAEVAEVAALVRSRPLVTLTGVGGVGKTRLAFEVAAEVVVDFPDGAWVCELASVGDPDALWETVASMLRVLPMPGRSLDDVVLDYLASKVLLLVIDNCEHLLDAVAALVDSVGARCERVAILATSREGLAVRGEQIVAVPSLGVPADDVRGDALTQAEAVVLFCDRARSARNDFVLTDDNAEAVGVLCRRLDGIPLAIELAAARVRSLSPDDLVNRLDQRFKLLTRGSRSSLERHQTLRNTIDWSYQLLDERERTALNRLSVFAGGCDLAAAEAVLADDDLDALDVVDVVSQLVDKSLVLAEPDESGHLRYRLLEMIRQYAQEQLETSGEAPAVRRRHADHYVAVAETAGPGLRSPDQLEWARAVAREIDNLRTALDWAVDTPSADHALRLVAPLEVSGISTGYSAATWAEAAVHVHGASDHRLFRNVASWASWSAIARGDVALAERYLTMIDEAGARLGSGGTAAFRTRATLAHFRGDLEAARRASEEWVARARQSGSANDLSQALVSLAQAQASTGNPKLARATAEEGLEVARGAGVPSTLANALIAIPWSLLDEDPERARQLFEEGFELGQRMGDAVGAALAVTGMGVCDASLGRWDRALDQVRDAIARIRHVGTGAGLIGGTLGVAALVLTARGRFEHGAAVLGASYRFAPGAWPRPEQLRRDAAAILVEHLGQARYETLFSEGAELSADEALAALSSAIDSLE
jgi:predicted ATPase/class 3 adenylate cyclase